MVECRFFMHMVIKEQLNPQIGYLINKFKPERFNRKIKLPTELFFSNEAVGPPHGIPSASSALGYHTATSNLFFLTAKMYLSI